MGFRSALWLLIASIVTAQTVAPSNGSELGDAAGSPRFLVGPVGSVQFPTFALAALGSYASISRQTFVNIGFSGPLIYTDASNANQIRSADFSLVSCDPEHYEGGNIDAGGILRIISQQQSNWMNQKASLIFYTTRANHCNITDFNGLPTINGVFTMIDPIMAQQLQDMNFTRASNAQATLYPDRSSFINGVGSTQQTTAIAMIILYSITGCVTALFVAVIITGAIRAHRHPERYGPRNIPGRARQSRAKGIARAMLETLPIVKFGDHHDEPKNKTPTGDIELANTATTDTATNKATADKSATITTAAVGTKPTSVASSSKGEAESGSKPDGSDEAGTLGCSICTEDFQKGEEVRVLPCNHKFHPECVDPWLLNVSGTCPLCRISLAPEGEHTEAGATSGDMPPPLAENVPVGDRRSQALHNLMAMAYGSREERINALRRYRTDRRNRSLAQNNENAEESVGRARRFREAFRIRTRRHDPARHDPLEAAAQRQDPGIEALSGPMRL